MNLKEEYKKLKNQDRVLVSFRNYKKTVKNFDDKRKIEAITYCPTVDGKIEGSTLFITREKLIFYIGKKFSYSLNYDIIEPRSVKINYINRITFSLDKQEIEWIKENDEREYYGKTWEIYGNKKILEIIFENIKNTSNLKIKKIVENSNALKTIINFIEKYKHIEDWSDKKLNKLLSQIRSKYNIDISLKNLLFLLEKGKKHIELEKKDEEYGKFRTKNLPNEPKSINEYIDKLLRLYRADFRKDYSTNQYDEEYWYTKAIEEERRRNFIKALEYLNYALRTNEYFSKAVHKKDEIKSLLLHQEKTGSDENQPDLKRKNSNNNKIATKTNQDNSHEYSGKDFTKIENDLITNKSDNKIVRMGNEPKKENIPILIKHTKSENSNDRRLAASALGKLCSLKPDIYTAVPTLISLLNDKKPQVRQYAIKALGKIGDKRAKPHLKKILEKDEKEYNRVSAKKALEINNNFSDKNLKNKKELQTETYTNSKENNNRKAKSEDRITMEEKTINNSLCETCKQKTVCKIGKKQKIVDCTDYIFDEKQKKHLTKSQYDEEYSYHKAIEDEKEKRYQDAIIFLDNKIESKNEISEKQNNDDNWTEEVKRIIFHEILSDKFNLRDVYAYESKLKKKYPKNDNIKEKIRQELQILRNKGFIVFLGDENYSVTSHYLKNRQLLEQGLEKQTKIDDKLNLSSKEYGDNFEKKQNQIKSLKGRVFTIGKISQLNGLLKFCSSHGSISRSDFIKFKKVIFKNPQIKHPLHRGNNFCAFAEGLGILYKISGKYFLTENGKEFAGYLNNSDLWKINSEQAEILRSLISSKELNETSIVYPLNKMILLINNGLSDKELYLKFRDEIGRSNEWQSEITIRDYSKFVINYLKELLILDKNGNFTQIGNEYIKILQINHQLKVHTIKNEGNKRYKLKTKELEICDSDNWSDVIEKIIKKINKKEFTKNDILKYITELMHIYPNNYYIDATVSSILKKLCDKNIIERIDDQTFRIINYYEKVTDVNKSDSLSLDIGEIYDNDQIQRIFKCSSQGGMRRSHRTNTLVLISNQTDTLYNDVLKCNFFHYTGMGKSGDQSLNFAQNKTLNESKENRVNVHLFVVFDKGKYTYLGRVELDDTPYQEDQTDENNNTRKVWIFPLKLQDEFALNLLKKETNTNEKVIEKDHKDEFEKYVNRCMNCAHVSEVDGRLLCSIHRIDIKRVFIKNCTQFKTLEKLTQIDADEEEDGKKSIQLLESDYVQRKGRNYIIINSTRTINCKEIEVKHPNKYVQNMINKASRGILKTDFSDRPKWKKDVKEIFNKINKKGYNGKNQN